MSVSKRLGHLLHQYRKEAGLSQLALSVEIDVHVNTVSNFERGVNTPDFETLIKILEALNVSLSALTDAYLSDNADQKKTEKPLTSSNTQRSYSTNDILDWLRERKGLLSIRKIEGQIGCPNDTLQKALLESKGFPGKWQQPLKEWFEGFKAD